MPRAAARLTNGPAPWPRAPRLATARLTSCSTGMKKPGARVNITAQIAASGADAFSSRTCAEMLRNA